MLPILLLPFLAASPASAASSQWIKSEGGAVRLVTSGLSGEDGRLRGALEIVLEPGWKTYWRDPGPTGVPPQIDLAPNGHARGAEILFPAPERIKDDYATWAGYTESVTLPVLFTLPEPGSAGLVEGSVFLGICKTICIPVQGSFSVDAGADPDNPADAISVQGAFASLPGKPHAGLEIGEVSRDGGHVLFKVNVAEAASNDLTLFVAASNGGQLSTPGLIRRDENSAVFSSDIISLPEGAREIHYTLTTESEAVGGTIELP